MKRANEPEGTRAIGVLSPPIHRSRRRWPRGRFRRCFCFRSGLCLVLLLWPVHVFLSSHPRRLQLRFKLIARSDRLVGSFLRIQDLDGCGNPLPKKRLLSLQLVDAPRRFLRPPRRRLRSWQTLHLLVEPSMQRSSSSPLGVGQFGHILKRLRPHPQGALAGQMLRVLRPSLRFTSLPLRCKHDLAGALMHLALAPILCKLGAKMAQLCLGRRAAESLGPVGAALCRRQTSLQVGDH